MEQNTVDILLLDINLSEESGFTLCKRLREQTDMPILLSVQDRAMMMC